MTMHSGDLAVSDEAVGVLVTGQVPQWAGHPATRSAGSLQRHGQRRFLRRAALRSADPAGRQRPRGGSRPARGRNAGRRRVRPLLTGPHTSPGGARLSEEAGVVVHDTLPRGGLAPEK